MKITLNILQTLILICIIIISIPFIIIGDFVNLINERKEKNIDQ